MKMKEALLRDIKRLKSPQGYLYAGLPRYKGLFGRDSCITGWQLLKIYPEIAKATLKVLARYQGKDLNQKSEEQPGKVLHEHYQGFWQRFKHLIGGKFKWSFPYYGSIDSTAWWLILLGKYYHQTEDKDLVREFWPNVLKALAWIEDYGEKGEDGFIRGEKKNPYGLFHQSWKDGLQIPVTSPIAMVEVQGYYYLAYQLIAGLASRVMQDRKLGMELEEKALNLKGEFNRKFWIEGENYFVLALDGHNSPVKIVTSNFGQCLFTGIIDDNKVGKVIKRLFEKDLWTPYGIRTHSSKDSYFDPRSYHQGSIWPFDNWVIYKGLLKYGYQKEARMIEQSQIEVFRAFGYIPECFGVEDNQLITMTESCLIQAWSSAGLLEMILQSKDAR